MANTSQDLKNALAVGGGSLGGAVTHVSEKKTLEDLLKGAQFQAQMAMAMPKTLTPDRLTRVVLSECIKNPELYKCSKPSFFGAVLNAASLGLEPGGALGHCHLVPYKSKGQTLCQLIIGYRGMIALARRSGEIISLQAYAVHQKDHFDWGLGLNPYIEHKPTKETDTGPLVYVYAVAKLKGGGVQFEVLSATEINRIRLQSKGGDSKFSPWVTHFEEMAKKSAVRRLFKYLPVSIEVARAIEPEEKTERDEPTTPHDVATAVFADTGRDIEDINPVPAGQITHEDQATPNAETVDDTAEPEPPHTWSADDPYMPDPEIA